MYGATFDSTKGFPGEGPISMKLTDKFFQCPTIMGKTWVKAVMNKKQATIIINQMKILRSTSKYKNKRDREEEIYNISIVDTKIRADSVSCISMDRINQ